MMSKKVIFCVLVSVTLFITGFSQNKRVAPGEVFNSLWKYFDKHYALFEVKKIDWGKQYLKYKNQIASSTNDSALFVTLSNMLAVLDDHHVNLASQFARFNSGINRNKSDFDFSVIKANYLKSSITEQIIVPGPNNTKRSLLKSGLLDGGIVYIHIGGFRKGEELLKGIDSILNASGNSAGLVIDLRNNGGGADEIVEAVSGRFTSERLPFAKIKFRYGANHNSFTYPEENLYMETEGKSAFAKPIVILGNRNTASAAENFILAMRSLRNTVIIGDTTAGVYSTTLESVLSNGWEFSCSNAVYQDMNDKCYEGLGLAPDSAVNNTKENLQAGKDLVLEEALQILLNKNHVAKKYHNDVKGPIKKSIVKSVLLPGNDYSQKFFQSSQQLLSNNKNSYYYSDREAIDGLFGKIEMLDSHQLKSWLQFMVANTKSTLHSNLIRYLYFVVTNNATGAKSIIDKVVKSGLTEDMLYSEEFLNNTGYAFATDKFINIAITILETNARLHSESPNVYDSLGEIYLKKGDKAKALENYKKLLQLVPDNEDVKKKIKELEVN